MIEVRYKCRHAVTRGREGLKGTWCESCGMQVLAVHDRPCGECRHFQLDRGARVMGICGPKLMTVTSTMLVTYYLEPDQISRPGLCFEAVGHEPKLDS